MASMGNRWSIGRCVYTLAVYTLAVYTFAFAGIIFQKPFDQPRGRFRHRRIHQNGVWLLRLWMNRSGTNHVFIIRANTPCFLPIDLALKISHLDRGGVVLKVKMSAFLRRLYG